MGKISYDSDTDSNITDLSRPNSPEVFTDLEDFDELNNNALFKYKMISKTEKSLKEPYESKNKLCKICGKLYTASNATNHKKTQRHLLYERINRNILKALILDNNEPVK